MLFLSSGGKNKPAQWQKSQQGGIIGQEHRAEHGDNHQRRTHAPDSGKGMYHPLGKSGYSFRRLVKDLIYDITAHTAFPLLMVRNIGIASFLVSLCLAIYYLVRYFMFGISVEGWTSLMLVMLAFFGLTLLSIGIIGIYLMNILNEAKKMPHYVIRQEETD